MKEADTRTQILDIAQELIQRHGLNGMSFQDISDTVGVRKASIHHHFATKTEMVNTLLGRYQEDFRGAVAQVLRSRGLARTKLNRYFGLFIKTLQAAEHDKSCLCGMLAAEISSLDNEGVNLIRQFLRSNVDQIREIIKEGVQDGSLSDLGDVTTTAEMVLATLEGGLLIARCDGGPEQLAAMFKRLLSVLSSE